MQLSSCDQAISSKSKLFTDSDSKRYKYKIRTKYKTEKKLSDQKQETPKLDILVKIT